MRKRTYQASGHYRSPNIDADFTATITDGSYPDEMPGRNIEGVELTSLNICGFEVDLEKDFPHFPKEFQDRLLELADDVEWIEE